MSMVLDPPRIARGASASAADALLAEWSVGELNDLSIPELDAELAIAERVASFSRGRQVWIAAQRAKLIEAGRPKQKPGTKPEPDEKPPPKPGKSRAEQLRDAAAARAVRWAPSFGVALQAGEVSMDHVVALGRVRNFAYVPQHETALLCVARMRTAEDFAKHLNTWDAARDREAGIDRAAALRARRKVSFFDRDGLRAMFAMLPSDDAAKVENAMREIANELFHLSADDGTTISQRMADALVLMADRATGNAESSKANRPTVVVICDEDSLRDRVDDAGLGYMLDGTPVSATELRRLACDANILPAVMNGAGQILDWGRSHRTATDVQRLALLTMYGGCIIDGCGCPTQLLEIHHLRAFEAGGRTDLDAMAPLCKGDHTRSHAEKWVFTRDPDGHILITTRYGVEIPTRRPRKPERRGERTPPDERVADATCGAPAHAPPGSLFDGN